MWIAGANASYSCYLGGPRIAEYTSKGYIERREDTKYPSYQEVPRVLCLPKIDSTSAIKLIFR